MIEKDNIQELFSKAFENQTAPVRPDLWAGVQAKMAAAGVASTATVATKGLSALTKWIIGSAAVGTVGVVTTVVALNSGEETVNQKADSPKEISQNTTVASQDEHKPENTKFAPHTIYTKPEVVDDKSSDDIQQAIKPTDKEYKKPDDRFIIADDHVAETIKADKSKQEDRTTPADNGKKEPGDRTTDSKKSPVDKKEDKETPVVKHPENTKEPVFADLQAKVTKFPSIFTPNSDGSNDYYFVEAENIRDFQLVIIDQNNREMFRSNIPGEREGWNGRDKSGDEAPNGSYAAIVTGKDQNGKSFRDIQLFELRR
ncbi:gliding motility-associated C-terminal domain-containing protein [Fluviicola sp.]|uniref:T9SS type B sorting domain-containing protein n=1 Tax=Fluviicola sp. TaxID=1917219 RepID=UPI0031E1471A